MATKPAEAPVPEVIAVEMAKDRQLRREERQSLTAIPAANLAESPQRTTFMPQSMGEAMQLATIMARSTFVPQHCRGNEGNCLAIIMQASRWGMDPFAVANKAYFTKDGAPPAFESQLVNAVVNSSGVLSGRLRVELTGEGEKLRCTVRGFLRADPNDEKVKTQSISRISVRNSPLWKSDPEQQLLYYTTRAWARAWVPEVLLGVYTPDEIDLDPERARVVSPPLPRRGGVPDLVDSTDEEPDEEMARQLDNDGFAAMEGRVEGQQHPSAAIAQALLDQLTDAKDAISIDAIADDLAAATGDMREGEVEAVKLAIANARKALPPVSKAKGKPKEGAEPAEPETGRADADHGDQNDGNAEIADKLIERVGAATVMGDVIAIEQEYQNVGRAMLDVAEQDRVEAAIAAAKAKFRATKA